MEKINLDELGKKLISVATFDFNFDAHLACTEIAQKVNEIIDKLEGKEE